MLAKWVKAGLVATAVALVVQSVPDIKRYLVIRRM